MILPNSHTKAKGKLITCMGTIVCISIPLEIFIPTMYAEQENELELQSTVVDEVAQVVDDAEAIDEVTGLLEGATLGVADAGLVQ